MKKINVTLVDELSSLRIRNAELETLEIEHNWMEKALMKQAHDLKERVKEINCLYGISKLVEGTDLSLKNMDNIYQGIIELIPSSWQYPKNTCAEIVINDQKFITENHRKSPWKISANIVVNGEKSGVISVYYLEERPTCFEGPFLKEERSLLNAIAERLGRITERKYAEKALRESKKKLKNQNLLLQEKNITLREVMNQLITEKNNLENRVLDNVDQLLSPLLKKLKNKGSIIDKSYIDLLEDNVAKLTSSFSSELSKNIPKLTPRENEICNMIRGGLTSKEVARLLNISYRSVETYRNYIRKKLGIINQKINLTTYLGAL